MATPLARRPEPGDGSPQAAVSISSVTEYLLPATMRGIAVQAMAALGVLTGLWIALSPSFLTLQHGGGNAAAADLIAGLAVAAVGAASLAGPRGYAGLQFASVLLGVWVIISPFILDAKFSIAAPMYWSNILSGGYLVVLALAGLATVRRATGNRTRASPTPGPAPRSPAGLAPALEPRQERACAGRTRYAGAASRSRPQVRSIR